MEGMKSVFQARHRKVTVLHGKYATGDFESMCWDEIRSPHGDERDHVLQAEQRVYPDDCISPEMRGQRGDWRITVEFFDEGML